MKKWVDGRWGKPIFPGSVEDNRSGRAQLYFLTGRFFGFWDLRGVPCPGHNLEHNHKMKGPGGFLSLHDPHVWHFIVYTIVEKWNCISMYAITSNKQVGSTDSKYSFFFFLFYFKFFGTRFVVDVWSLSWNYLWRRGWPETHREIWVCFLCAGIKGVSHHCWYSFLY